MPGSRSPGAAGTPEDGATPLTDPRPRTTLVPGLRDPRSTSPFPRTRLDPGSPNRPSRTEIIAVTESELAPPTTDTWEGILQALRRRYPGQKDSVLFCIYKLQQNPDLTLRDFRAEADLHGIPMAGRALHSARGLLGLQKAAAAPTPPAAAEPAPPPRRRPRGDPEVDDGGASIESKVVAAVRQIQSAAGAESGQLRTAMRRAITILQQALDAP
jgi:hypothetical protein